VGQGYTKLQFGGPVMFAGNDFFDHGRVSGAVFSGLMTDLPVKRPIRPLVCDNLHASAKRRVNKRVTSVVYSRVRDSERRV
jgi:hypothetical protein